MSILFLEMNSFILQTEIGNVIIVNFIGTFDIESHQSGNCPYDWIQVNKKKHADIMRSCTVRTPKSRFQGEEYYSLQQIMVNKDTKIVIKKIAMASFVPLYIRPWLSKT